MPATAKTRQAVQGALPIIVSGLTALALCLRGLTSQPLSHDEFYSLHAIKSGLDEHLFEIPWLPYYGVLWAWSWGGSFAADYWLRLLSAFAMAGVAMLAAAIGMRLHSSTAGLAAGLLVALNPAIQRFGQDARAYALGALLFAGATYFLVAGMTDDRKRTWLAYALLMATGTLITPFGLAVLPAHGVILWLYGVRGACLRRWAIACAPALPIAAVGAYYAATDFDSPKSWAPRPSIIDAASGFEWLGSAAATPLAASGAVAGLVLAMCLLSRDGARWFAGALVGLMATWVVSQGSTSFWAGQYVLSLVTLVAIGAGLTLASQPRWTIAAVLALTALISIPAFSSLRAMDPREPDMRLAANLVAENGTSTDSVFDDGQIFGLSQALQHYAQDLEVTPSANPSSRYWTIYGAKDCAVLLEFDIGGDATLTLCTAPSSTALDTGSDE